MSAWTKLAVAAPRIGRAERVVLPTSSIPDNYDRLDVIRDLRKAVEEELNRMPLRDGWQILDFGCGSGYFSSHFHQRRCDVLGLDIDSRLIQKARILYPFITFEIGDAASLSSGSYDLVFINMVICNMGRHHYVAEAFRHFWRCLKPEGMLFMTSIDLCNEIVSNANVIHSLVGEYYEGAPMMVQLRENDGTYTQPWRNYIWTKDQIERFLSAARFAVLQSEYLNSADPYYYCLAEKRRR